jgi:hypothetical protein
MSTKNGFYGSHKNLAPLFIIPRNFLVFLFVFGRMPRGFMVRVKNFDPG